MADGFKALNTEITNGSMANLKKYESNESRGIQDEKKHKTLNLNTEFSLGKDFPYVENMLRNESIVDKNIIV